MELIYALRDEIVNIFSMTFGFENLYKNHQILLCKKEMNPHIGPFLLDTKLTKATFKLSSLGSLNENSILNEPFPLEYVAFIDSYLKVNVNYEMFENLCNRFFQVWDPIAPFNYFENQEQGYLAIFRVYKITKRIEEGLLSKGKRGRNYYYKLSIPQEIKLLHPVLNEETFIEMKTNLLRLVNPWLVNIAENEDKSMIYDTSAVSTDILQSYEKLIEQIVEEKNLGDLLEIIRSKLENIRKSTIETIQYLRDHNVRKYAKIRSKGKCECCDSPAPFITENEEPFLEIHHLVPLSDGGTDSPDNVVAVCPNCHQRFHHSKEREILTDKIFQKLRDLER